MDNQLFITIEQFNSILDEFENSYKVLNRNEIYDKLLNILIILDKKYYNAGEKVKYVNKHTNDSSLTICEQLMNIDKICLKTYIPECYLNIAFNILIELFNDVNTNLSEIIDEMKDEENVKTFKELFYKLENKKYIDNEYNYLEYEYGYLVGTNTDKEIKRIRKNRWISNGKLTKYHKIMFGF